MKYLWLFDSDSVAVIPVICGALFALGGSGFKSLRRFAVPLFIFLSAWSVGVNHYLSAVACVLLSVALSKGYGDDLREEVGEAYYYPLLYVIGLAYGGSLMPMASKIWHLFLCFIPSVTFGALSFSSQNADFPKWKWVEIATGFSIGIVALILISGGL